MDPGQVEWHGKFMVDVVAPMAQQGRSCMTRSTPDSYNIE